ncbi:MAG: glycoside hydrolase family 92 protein, partial [Bacteroidales bacterium]|nr:glycoside hydrolase family 92 protein [Bacteroidales bacterium]
MKRFTLTLAAVVSAIALSGQPKTSYVNPMIGTGRMGHVFPGACVPHGIVALSPDTDTIPHNIEGKYQPRAYEYCAGYQYDDPTIVGFSHTHFSGTGHSDLGDILIMPATGPVKFNPGTTADPDSGYRSRYSHESEKAVPGYYEVTLDDYGVKAQLTATKRCGVHRYTFPQDADNPHIMLDLNHAIYNYDGKVLWANVRVENDRLVTGYRITNGWARTNYTYFAIRFSKPIRNYGYTDFATPSYRGGFAKFDVKHNFPEIGGKQVVCHFDFDPADGQPIEIRVGLSAVSCEGALKNLDAETQGKEFDCIVAEADTAWEDALGVIDVQGDADQMAMFYTSLYHTMINPSVYMDVDGSYRGLDHNIHKADGFTNYTVFSLWDTYRALMPLYNIIDRKGSRDMAMSMLAHYDQSVHHILPVWSHCANENWCMIGYHGVSVLADAIAKGIDIDKEKAMEAMVSSATLPYYGGTAEYMKLGYVPLEATSTAASNTFEYAYDDWAIANTARILGNGEVYAQFYARSANWKNSFDCGCGLARPKYADG